MSLSALLKKGGLRKIATATPATSATDRGQTAPSVATVATVAVATSSAKKSADAPIRAEDRVTPTVADMQVNLEFRRWPHDDAMTAVEADRCIDRRARLLACGQAVEDAERLAYKLLIRDREGDDRRMCLECNYYGSSGRCVAAATGRLVGASAWLEPVPTILQRCEAFGLRKGHIIDVTAMNSTSPKPIN